ncbi:hypothetical protein GX441_04155 [bacterium]|nr:hypothetical protein [bacterium]
MLRIGAALLLVSLTGLSAGGWAFGIGGGGINYISSDTLSVYGVNVGRPGWRLDAEAGYYSGREGFNILGVWAESFTRIDSSSSYLRDSHAALMGEYRLFLLDSAGIIQGAVGLGPSLHFPRYRSGGTVHGYPPVFSIDAEAACILFVSEHFLIRLQGVYSFMPLYPRNGIASISLRAVLRS